MAGRATTIATQLGGKNVTLRGSNGAQQRTITFTTESVSDHVQLVRQLNDLMRLIQETVAVANSSPLTSAILIKNITFTAGQTQNLEHKLDREPTGWFCIRALTGDATFREATLGTGLSRNRYLAIRAANAGTYDFIVF